MSKSKSTNTSKIATFVTNDLKNIRREHMLIYIMLVPLIMIAFLRFFLPPLTIWTIDSFDLSLADYYPLILSFFVVIEMPFIFGVLYGLLLLDEKDENIFNVLRVTPISLDYYLRYRFSVIILSSVLFVSVGLPLTGFMSPMSISAILSVGLVGGMGGVLLTLIMIGFANNKLEGLALMKAFGIMTLAPMGGYFIESNWHLLLGIFPFYWPAKAFWLFSQGLNGWVYILIGIGYLSILFFLLYRRFKSRIGLET